MAWHRYVCVSRLPVSGVGVVSNGGVVALVLLVPFDYIVRAYNRLRASLLLPPPVGWVPLQCGLPLALVLAFALALAFAAAHRCICTHIRYRVCNDGVGLVGRVCGHTWRGGHASVKRTMCRIADRRGSYPFPLPLPICRAAASLLVPGRAGAPAPLPSVPLPSCCGLGSASRGM